MIAEIRQRARLFDLRLSLIKRALTANAEGLTQKEILKLCWGEGNEQGGTFSNLLEFVSKSERDLLPPAISNYVSGGPDSVDEKPWAHPFLTHENIVRFRRYSEMVWRYVIDHREKMSRPLKCAFTVNMAQNMYNWSRLVRKCGAEVALYLNPMDHTVISRPEWEHFDGSWGDIFDGESFLSTHTDIQLEVPCYTPQMNGLDLPVAYRKYCEGDRRPLFSLLAGHPGIRHEALLGYNGIYPYYEWARNLTAHDVIYAAGLPIAAYASGRPYCVCPVGADLTYDCGRGDDYGRILSLSFNAARFIVFSGNAQNLGHFRRLGFTNAVLIPYPIDDDRYSPGEGFSRHQWEKNHGKGFYVLMTARIDGKIKGQDDSFFSGLIEVVKKAPHVRFLFLKWGSDAGKLQAKIDQSGLGDNLIMMPPVGKERLIDYYRSCDVVIDQLTSGYNGLTSLEAASVGKPVIMYLRMEHHDPMYDGDEMPIFNVTDARDLIEALLALVEHKDLIANRSLQVREWIVRNHGASKTAPLLSAILRFSADSAVLPQEILKLNPLLDKLTDDEKDYHNSCIQN